MTQDKFEQLISEALALDFSGWDFSFLRARWVETEPSWNYAKLVQDRVSQVGSLLDMGTGGGEFLASLPHLPQLTFATENYEPNLPVARARLEPLGVKVETFEHDRALPLPDDAFELVINRHESFWPAEVNRILKPQGIFLIQQVGPANCIQLNEFLDAPIDAEVGRWKLTDEANQLENAGLKILRQEELFLDSIFYDIGAVVLYLKIIAWQIPDFEIARYRPRLRAMHDLIEAQGAFYTKCHRYLIEAKKS